MSTPAQFAAKCNKFAATLPRETIVGTGQAALLVKTEAIRQLRAVVPSGKLKNGARLNVSYDKAPGGDGSVIVRATGPWQLVENDTDAHVITSRYAGGTRRQRGQRASFIGPQFSGRGRNRQFRGRTGGGRRAVVSLPGIGPRRSVRHPGTRGQHPWRKTTDRAPRLVFGIYERAVNRALVSTFTGG